MMNLLSEILSPSGFGKMDIELKLHKTHRAHSDSWSKVHGM